MSFFFGRRTAAEAPQAPAAQQQPRQFGGPTAAAGLAGGGTPLELVRFDPDSGQFELGTAALEVLRRTRGPIGVVAVAGRARQGKSYILNQLLGRSSGFQVAPTHRPCTKGLWMWSAPMQCSAPDGSTYNLLLLDTEGIDAYDQVRMAVAVERVRACGLGEEGCYIG